MTDDLDKRTDKQEYDFHCWFCGCEQLTATKAQVLDGSWSVRLKCYACKQDLIGLKDTLHETMEGMGLTKHGMKKAKVKLVS